MGSYNEEDVAFMKNGVLNVMKYLKMLAGSPSNTSDYRKIVVHRGHHDLKATRGGFFVPDVKVGDVVAEGQAIGIIRNLFGQTLDKIVAPVGGVVLLRMTPSSVSTGDLLITLCEFEPF
jgi:predicted deacylase